MNLHRKKKASSSSEKLQKIMLTLIANTTRSHGGIEMRFAEPSRNINSTSTSTSSNTDTRAAVEHLEIPNRVHHWFRGGFTCRLCDAIHQNPKEHFQSGVEARHHVVKEIFLSYFMEEDKKGLPLTGQSLWESRLRSKRRDTNLLKKQHEVMKNHWKQHYVDPRTLSSLYDNNKNKNIGEQRRMSLIQRSHYLYWVLHFLKETKMLGASLCPARPGPTENLSGSTSTVLDGGRRVTYTKSVRNTCRFESLEYCGDSLWGFEATARLVWMMPHRDWLSYSHAWAGGILRDGVESNDNLMRVAELIGIQNLLPDDVILGGGKPLADVLESVMGEMHCRLMELRSNNNNNNNNDKNNTPHHPRVLITMLEFAIAEINDLAALNFGYTHCGFEAENTLLPFAKELIHSSAQMKMEPAMNFNVKGIQRPLTFFRGRRLRGLGLSSSSSSNNNLTSSSSYYNSTTSSLLLEKEFTFLDVKLHPERKCSKKENSKIDRSLDPILNSHFSNLRNSSSSSSSLLSSCYQQKISMKSFDSAVSKFIFSEDFIGENSYSATATQEMLIDETTSTTTPKSLQEKFKENMKHKFAHSHDRLRVATFAEDCLPELLPYPTTEKEDDDEEDTSVTLWMKIIAQNNRGDRTRNTTITDSHDNSTTTSNDSLSQFQPPDESRIFPIHEKFETDSGHVPQIVLDVEAKRQNLVNSRKKMRKLRRI
jgi:hypothetical protein